MKYKSIDRRSLISVSVGTISFVVVGLLRLQAQDSLNPEPWLGLILTVLAYLIPGMIVGVMVWNHPLLPALALGVITLPVVLALFGLEVLRFAPTSAWYASILTWLALGILICPVGGLLGARLRISSVSDE